MTKQLLQIIILFFALAPAAYGHPHAFVECTFSFVMDKDGLVGFKQRWILDEMTSVSVLDVVDTNRDGVLSAEEKTAVRDLSVESLLDYHYFTVARVNGKDFPITKITDFSAALKNGKLTYDFLIPCRVTSSPGKRQEVKAAVYDDSFYTFVAYAEEGKTGLDPTKDPLFANREAPANPEDFKRFSKAVGVGKFKGDIQIQGNTANFKITATIRDEAEMAYFYNQIVPQAFVLSFETK